MRVVLAGLIVTVIGTAPALSEPTLFPGSDYGQVTLRLRESLGSAVAQVIERGDIFQRVGRLRPDDKLRTVSDRVVRLDRLLEVDGRQVTSTCTGTIVADDLVLTNYHCIPGFGETIRQASILIGYEEEDDPDAVRLPIQTRPVKADDQLDYALVRIEGALPAGLTPLPLVPAEAQPNERLTVLHHPAGRPKMMTVHECFAYASASPRATELRHVCDTLPGSSGGLLINVDRQPVGLHHTGGLRKGDAGSYNLATRMSAVREALNSLLPVAASADTSGASSSYGETVPGTAAAGATAADRSAPTLSQPTANPQNPSVHDQIVQGRAAADPSQTPPAAAPVPAGVFEAESPASPSDLINDALSN